MTCGPETHFSKSNISSPAYLSFYRTEHSLFHTKVENPNPRNAPLLKLCLTYAAVAVLTFSLAKAQVFPESSPANRIAAGKYGPRSLSLGEPSFTDSRLYNLFDQGGSPMGLFESRQPGMLFGAGYLGSFRATPGDSLTLDHGDLSIPQLGFHQQGIFVANLYYLHESEAYRQTGGDSVENSAHLFGLDLAGGPESGLFRMGFGAHFRLGGMEYGGGAKRTLLSLPSVRIDLSSRLHPALEVGLFVGVGARLDSLESPAGHLERVASFNLPRYGILADVGGTEDLPLMGNVVLELGTDRQFGEYRPANSGGIEFPTVLTDYWTFQTQWIYPLQVEDFSLQPAMRFARRSETAQGYVGIKGNKDPFKKGAKIDSLQMDRGITDFGLGGQIGYKEIVSLLVEWETAGHTYKSDSTAEARYNRFSVGVEHHVHRLPISFPEKVTLDLRAGWTLRDGAESAPGYRAFQFDPFLPSALPDSRGSLFNPVPDEPAGYSAFSLGFGLGLLEEHLLLDGYLGFPGQPERIGVGTQKATGTEFGVTLSYRI